MPADNGAINDSSPRTDTPQLAELLKAIACSASNGATYPWIAGVLAGCLAEQNNDDRGPRGGHRDAQSPAA